MSDRDPVIYGTPQAISLPIGNVGIGSYVVNDYLLTVAEDDGGNGYLFTIKKGSEVQTIHLTELTQEAVNNSIETALSQAKESGEFDGNGIESAVFNPDYTLSLYFTDGTSVTTGSIKGEKGDSGTGITSVVYNDDHTLTINLTDGTSYRTDSIKGNKGDTGVGIASTELNSNHTLTIRYTDGTNYTTPSIRGEKGDKGDKGDPGDSIEFHICSSSEYDHTTMTPTVANPKSTAFYLVPSTSAVNTDLFIEWVYVNGAWEKFGSATINLDSYATKTEVSAKMDKATNTGSAGQVLTSNGSGGQTWSSVAVPDWNAASGSAGFIRNKPDFKAGTGVDSITNRHSMVSGSHSMATGTNNTISGADSYATGSGNNIKSTGTLMTGSYNTAELRGSNGLVGGTSNSVSNTNAIAAGNNNAVSGINSVATGTGNIASGSNSSVSGENVIANHKSQTVSGEYNVSDPSSAAATARGNYVEIIGNGTADNARSNARTLDWSGNEWIKGNFKMGGTSYNDPEAVEVATKNDIVTPDWEAAEGEDGYILNKVPLVKGGGVNSIQSIPLSVADMSVGMHTLSVGGPNSYFNSISGEANVTTYNYISDIPDNIARVIQQGVAIIAIASDFSKISKITGIDTTQKTITVETTLSENSALNRQQVVIAIYNFASGNSAVTLGSSNIASGSVSFSIGSLNIASGSLASASGVCTLATGVASKTSGTRTIANHACQNAFGAFNIEDPSTETATARGNYIEIVGNGTADDARSNARTLDWTGNQWLAGNLKVGGTGYDDPNAKELATKEYVDQAIQNLLASLNQ